MKEPSLSPFIPLFLEMMIIERGASKNTFDSYKRDLIGCALFLRTLGLTLETAEAPHLRSYIQFCYDHQKSPRTIDRKSVV